MTTFYYTITHIGKLHPRSQVQGHTQQNQPDLDLSAEVLNFHTNTHNHLMALPSRASQDGFQIINSYVIFTDLVNHNTSVLSSIVTLLSYNKYSLKLNSPLQNFGSSLLTPSLSCLFLFIKHEFVPS